MANSSYETIKFKLIGEYPLIQHNGQLADPQNEVSRAMKQLTDKKSKKTDSDIDNLMRLELMGGTYWDDQIGVYIPDDVIEGSLLGGAKKRRAGDSVRTGCRVVEPRIKLYYKGMDEIETLDDIADSGNHRFVKGVVIGRVRVMRARPIFYDWSASVTVNYAVDLINRERLIEYMQIAGRDVGICDWRPKYGRFSVEVL